MDNNLDLHVYTNQGRPSNKELNKSINELKDDLKRLENGMNYKLGTKILLELSVSSENMTCHVFVFPKIFDLDGRGNTDRKHETYS